MAPIIKNITRFQTFDFGNNNKIPDLRNMKIENTIDNKNKIETLDVDKEIFNNIEIPNLNAEISNNTKIEFKDGKVIATATSKDNIKIEIDITEEYMESLTNVGFTKKDITRLINNEITTEQLVQEINMDTNTYRKKILLQNQYLRENNYPFHNIKDVNNEIERLKAETNKLALSDFQKKEIIDSLNMKQKAKEMGVTSLQNPQSYRYIGEKEFTELHNKITDYEKLINNLESNEFIGKSNNNLVNKLQNIESNVLSSGNTSNNTIKELNSTNLSQSISNDLRNSKNIETKINKVLTEGRFHKAVEKAPSWGEAWSSGALNRYTAQSLEGQCTWFNCGKMYETYGLIQKFPGNGQDIVNNILTDAEFGSKFYRSNTPEAGAVGSYKKGEYGHVFFVTKVDGDNITVQEGNVQNWLEGDHPYGEAIKNYQEKVYTRAELNRDYPNAIYAAPTDELKKVAADRNK